MAGKMIRAVVIHRPTDFEMLIATHGTIGQAEFFLRTRGQRVEPIEREHHQIQDAIAAVLGAIPSRWRRASLRRAELSRFLFEPDDLILVVGQDGLVANVSKYLSGQVVLGINPLPGRIDGLLVRHSVAAARDLLSRFERGSGPVVEERTMVQATLDDGQSLVALNELFIGHRSHQSARYTISHGERLERQSSSGLICSTGTGATGWARSIRRTLTDAGDPPAPTDPSLCYFVREAWPSRGTGTSLTFGRCATHDQILVTSEMNQGGVIFGDGIEEDYMAFDWGRVARIGVGNQRLRLA